MRTDAMKLPKEMLEWIAARGPGILAVDGRCGCGKSSLGEALARELGASLFHMDDFYLPFARRAWNWRQLPAGNMDLERFRREVLEPTLAGQPVSYRAYRCPEDRYLAPRQIPWRPVSIVEGSYSQHPLLADAYKTRLFVTAAPSVQEQRLLRRDVFLSGCPSAFFLQRLCRLRRNRSLSRRRSPAGRLGLSRTLRRVRRILSLRLRGALRSHALLRSRSPAGSITLSRALRRVRGILSLTLRGTLRSCALLRSGSAGRSPLTARRHTPRLGTGGSFARGVYPLCIIGARKLVVYLVLRASVKPEVVLVHSSYPAPWLL